jgi:hypothetical protein
LLQIVLALGSAGRFTRLLDGGKQQGNQDGDNGNDNK